MSHQRSGGESKQGAAWAQSKESTNSKLELFDAREGRLLVAAEARSVPPWNFKLSQTLGTAAALRCCRSLLQSGGLDSSPGDPPVDDGFIVTIQKTMPCRPHESLGD
ncbi:hypothetical protein M409DRAFT_50747 [Zasmidium cellare ATCC 36951]|uniref:Uncharacterized protein n=1 Tax=Zasmidium cellare ATCC 36951 TaxID=1080233 RepID=A0A6A6CX29_ZASCE|nr:uncharacterized protein M409DRAFT_50747 [Zasmidium cellare ATCC 36951]KAF2171283.1 hypothetical protein M409DRAFT_50747 [Zasmidium cellare ATCC 36951]